MTQAKRQFVENYINSLSNAVDTYNHSEPYATDQAEDDLFDTIIEIRNAFSKELPNIEDAVLLKNGTGLRDANSVLGILRLYLVNEDDHMNAETPLVTDKKETRKIFISHRSTDKKLADIIENFLTSCDISYSNIFCSSLPGNDIEEKISLEVKENLKASVLNIALLSADYYQSAYCQNEAGIIWFLDTEKIVIALPEIDDSLMEGFLNSEYKIRRLNSKSDISAICDIVKKFFPDFVSSNAKLNANIDHLIEQYDSVIKARKIEPSAIPSETNVLEKRILSNEFSDGELLVLNYFYDTQTNSISDDLKRISDWLQNKKVTISVKEAFDVLIDDEIIIFIDGGFTHASIYKMEINAYRQLRKLSQKAVDIFEKNCTRHKAVTTLIKSGNAVDNLIIKGFSEPEILLVKYIMDLQREKLYAGWQSDQEIKMIRNWEEINTLNDTLSQNYTEVLSKFEIRKFIEPCAKTSYGNTKEYKLIDSFLESLNGLSQSALEKIQSTMEENQFAEPELPF